MGQIPIVDHDAYRAYMQDLARRPRPRRRLSANKDVLAAFNSLSKDGQSLVRSILRAISGARPK